MTGKEKIRFLCEEAEQAGGALSFEKFMSLALYDPRFGYYGNTITGVGNNRGDFATAATLTKGLATSLFHCLEQENGFAKDTSLIEAGAGDGSLAAEILLQIPWLQRRKVDYRIVEISEPLSQQQKRNLKKHRCVSWHQSVSEAMQSCRSKVILFSNELVDAFPAHWLVWTGEEWQEIWLRIDESTGITEEFRPIAEPSIRECIAQCAKETDWPLGQRLELPLGFQDWLTELLRAREGRRLQVLTIDYGGLSAPEIYQHSPHGSMRAYFRNERFTGPAIYSRFGKQDITFDVNFGVLRDWGESLGGKTRALLTQGEFLRQFGAAGDEMAQGEIGSAFYLLWQVFD